MDSREYLKNYDEEYDRAGGDAVAPKSLPGGTHTVKVTATICNVDAGFNLVTLPWCPREWKPGYKVLLCEFTAADIAAIPIGGGKFAFGSAR